MRKFILVLLVNLCFAIASSAISLIPQPQDLTVTKGNFVLKKGVKVWSNSKDLQPASAYLNSLLSKTVGYSLSEGANGGNIELVLDSAAFSHKSAYTLSVTPKKVVIKAGDYQGIICGITTFYQLLPTAAEQGAKGKNWNLPCVEVKDSPKYDWRGLHLDVSRHFFNVDEVKAFLDLMAMYKLNKFHWHLTDDQGWRIEIKKYPLLTEKGAWRKYNNQDTICMNRAAKENNVDLELPTNKLRVVDGDTLYGGYYTQDQIRDVVKYAQQRGIDVIPELDMPGHILCALQNYKGISCFETTGWGTIFSSPVCPGKESALEFCKDIYKEVIDLFPYEYVHLGADEVEKTNWKKCPDCQRRIKALGLKNEEELQAWFVHYMEYFFNSYNRKLIGWDEIVDGGLSNSATVAWWRGWCPQSVENTTKQGNKIILCPTSFCYFDYEEMNSTMENMYNSDFYGKPLTDEQKQCIMGIQANLWSEWIPTVARLQYMAFPRALVIAEKGWTADNKMNWSDFKTRLKDNLAKLYYMGVNYRHQELDNYVPLQVFIDKGKVKFDCPDQFTQIRYTTDGTIPTLNSKLYTKPFEVSESTDFTMRLFSTKGKPGKIYKTRFEKQSYSPAESVADAKAGIVADRYEYAGRDCAGIAKSEFKKSYVCDNVQIPAEVEGNIGLHLHGYIEVPADGVYTFCLLSDDGSTLEIDGKMVVDNDGEHGPIEIKGSKALSAGLHKVEVRYFDHNGGSLKLKVLDEDGNEVKVSYKH